MLGPDPLAPTITLSWNNVSNNTGYKIEQKIGTGSWADLTPKGADITTHTDTGLSQGTTYTYRVTALGPAGSSMASNERTALTKPAAPTLGTPTGITNYQMTLAWNSTGASSYTLEMKPSGGDYGPAGAGCTSTGSTACTVTGLTSLTQYFFRVKATNASGDSTWSNETSATAILAAPTLNAPTTVTKNSMSLSWTAVSGAAVTSYPLQFKEGTAGEWIDSGCPVGTATSCTVSLPKPDTIYYFQVKARNSYGDSAWSNSTSAKTLLPEPQLLSVTGISTTTIDLVWSDNSLTENNYVVERSACSSPNTTSATCATGSGYSATWTNVSSNLPANTTSWSNSTAAAGTFYRYRVKATTTAGNSSIYSNILYASTRLAQPVMSSIVPESTTSLKINWGDITGETSYTLERKQGSSGTYAPVTSLAMNTVTYTDPILNTETEYCYRVMASTSFGVPSVYSSNELCKTTPLSAPVQALPVISPTAAQIDLSWSQTLYNTGYEVERCITTDNNQPVTHPLGTCTNLTPKPLQDINFLSNTVTAGNTYRYRVRAYYNNSTEYTSWSNEYWATAKPPKPTLNTPTVVSASQLNLAWNNVFGDIGYNIYWKVRSGATCTDDNWNGPLVTAINATSYPHGSLSPNTYYCYKINAKGPTGPPATPDSDFSSIVTQTTLPAATTLNAPTGITASNICLSWVNVMPNTGYKMERKIGLSGTWGTVGGDLPADNVNTTVNWCNNSGLASGTLYYYRVSVKNAAGYSAVSNERFATTTPAVPVITATVISDDRVDICWPLVFGATYYKLDRKIGSDGEYGPHANPSPPYTTSYCGEPSPTIGCPTATPDTYCYQDASLTAGTTYYYHVHAGNGTDSAESAERAATTLGFAGRNLTATALAGGLTIRLDWTPVACSPDPCDDPDYFEIQRQVRDGMWMQLKIVEGTATSYMDNVAIDPNGKYRYRIRSLKGALQSPYAEAEAFAKTYLTGTNVCR